ncbi:MAG: enoyl-ACP reductase [Sumerlaeia bacterium]
MLLKGKTALVTGVANDKSIAWAITEALLREGAKVVLTYQNERLERRVKSLAESIDPPLPCVQMDATVAEDLERAFGEISGLVDGKLDMLVHSIAYAKKEDLAGGVVDTSAEGFKMAQEISAFTLLSLTRAALPLLEAAGGGSVITMTYIGGERVVPNYNVMGICKASLESSARYLAYDLGPKNIRVNCVSAGPVKTLAARGISGFADMYDKIGERTALRRNASLEEVANAALFLLSPLAGGITGETLYVDGGYHMMGM